MIRSADVHNRYRAWNLVVVATSLFLLMASGCTKQDPMPHQIFSTTLPVTK